MIVGVLVAEEHHAGNWVVAVEGDAVGELNAGEIHVVDGEDGRRVLNAGNERDAVGAVAQIQALVSCLHQIIS